MLTQMVYVLSFRDTATEIISLMYFYFFHSAFNCIILFSIQHLDFLLVIVLAF